MKILLSLSLFSFLSAGILAAPREKESGATAHVEKRAPHKNAKRKKNKTKKSKAAHNRDSALRHEKKRNAKGASTKLPAIKNLKEIDRCLTLEAREELGARLKGFAGFKAIPAIHELIEKQFIPLFAVLEEFSRKLSAQGLNAKSDKSANVIKKKCKALAAKKGVSVKACVEKLLKAHENRGKKGKAIDAKTMREELLKPLALLDSVRKGKKRVSFLEFESTLNDFMEKADDYLIKGDIHRHSFEKIKDPSVRETVTLSGNAFTRLGKLLNDLREKTGALRNDAINPENATCDLPEYYANLVGKKPSEIKRAKKGERFDAEEGEDEDSDPVGAKGARRRAKTAHRHKNSGHSPHSDATRSKKKRHAKKRQAKRFAETSHDETDDDYDSTEVGGDADDASALDREGVSDATATLAERCRYLRTERNDLVAANAARHSNYDDNLTVNAYAGLGRTPAMGMPPYGTTPPYVARPYAPPPMPHAFGGFPANGAYPPNEEYETVMVPVRIGHPDFAAGENYPPLGTWPRYGENEAFAGANAAPLACPKKPPHASKERRRKARAAAPGKSFERATRVKNKKKNLAQRGKKRRHATASSRKNHIGA